MKSNKDGGIHKLLVLSGGTSSRCIAKNHWTFDLRKNYSFINYNKTNQEVEIGAGIKMIDLLEYLFEYGREFPIGLSGIPGAGYILTGGISPLSRSLGLAIDQIKSIHGIWGNGQKFIIKKPTNKSGSDEKNKWRGLCGAAPFLGIVTKLRLKTYQIKKLTISETIINKNELKDLIKIAEGFNENFSLQWIWGERIKILIVVNNHSVNSLQQKIGQEFVNIKSLKSLPSLSIDETISYNNEYIYSEVLGLLSESWGEEAEKIIEIIDQMIKIRPNRNCYIAAQQLGGKTSSTDKGFTSFIHRNSVWKPWINAAWEANNEDSKTRSMEWLNETWIRLKPYIPNVHSAQIHPHLSIHQNEIERSFREWLPGLRKLKEEVDPYNIFPKL